MSRLISFLWAFLTAPIAAVALHRLISNFVEVGIGPIAKQMVSFYETQILPLVAIVPDFLPFTFPDWYLDAAALSIFFSSIEYRAYAAETESEAQEQRQKDNVFENSSDPEHRRYYREAYSPKTRLIGYLYLNVLMRLLVLVVIGYALIGLLSPFTYVYSVYQYFHVSGSIRKYTLAVTRTPYYTLYLGLALFDLLLMFAEGFR
jgi:hypothetical protein